MRIPTATYRLQLNQAFGFKEARDIVPYLADLGITDIYASPIFKARKGSLHGYDVVNPNELNPELGSLSDFEALSRETRNHEMGWLQDIVPNHMAFDSENAMLMDIFENGRSSPFFTCFDIDWSQDEPAKPQVLAPFLGKFYGETLESGEISIAFGPKGLVVRYYDFVFPLKVESYVHVFTHRLPILREKLGESHSDFVRYLGALYILQALPCMDDGGERPERAKVIKKTLWDLSTENSTIAAFLDENLAEFNGMVGKPGSFNLLDDLLSEQIFRLSFWKVAYEEINYRRFFSINDLISMKVDDEQVFEHLHALILRMVSEGTFSGVRVDHIDGLYDPAEYLNRLKTRSNNIYTVVEKILALDEELPRGWPAQGTTGYDFLNYVNELFCHRRHEAAISRIYSNFISRHVSFQDLTYEKKRLIIEGHMGGDVDGLARLLKRVSALDRHGRDITLLGLRRALIEILTQFPVYRTYVSRDSLSERDREYITEAARRAAAHKPSLLNEINFLKKFFLLDFGPDISDEEKKQWVRFVMRFQQFTGPLMAKGFEDTLLYVYNRLISLNEVGSSPNTFGISGEEFHRFNTTRASFWPHALNATSTHDTKRGEDARARINVISEIPKEWASAVNKWSRLNRRKKTVVNDTLIPDRNDEYFFYQTLVGTFPAEIEAHDAYVKRLKEYAIKMVREAKVHTAWLKPDVEYEIAFLSFVEKAMDSRSKNAFLDDFLLFHRKIVSFGIFNSLSQALLKITSPGIPDFYQGTELWDLSLVDPDNRRPVDFQKRMRYLAEMKTKAQSDLKRLIRELLDSRDDGRIKFFLIHRLLAARKAWSPLFRDGSYIGLRVEGRFHENIIACARNLDNVWAITVAPRLLTEVIEENEEPLGESIWKDTTILLPEETPRRWNNMITDEITTATGALAVGTALEHFPVALLINKEEK